MDEMLHHLETMGNHCFVGLCNGIIGHRVSQVQDFVHPQYVKRVRTNLFMHIWCRRVAFLAGSGLFKASALGSISSSAVEWTVKFLSGV